MSAFFQLSTRVLTCDNCGAPVEVPIQGGQVKCHYCGVMVLVTARPVIGPTATPPGASATADEALRLSKLRSQNPRAPAPPSHIARLCPGLLLPDENVAPALELFQASRQRLKQGEAPDAERDLYFLAILFSNYYEARNDHLHERAFLETALESARTAQSRQTLCAMLAHTAAQLGEQHAAREWLARCDPRPDDIIADSDYRRTRAFVSLRGGDFADVLATLGEHGGDIPIAGDSDTSCTVYRAHALEMSQGVDAAVVELVRMANAQPGAWFDMAKTRKSNQRSGLVLCPESFGIAGRKLPWSRTNPYAMPLGCGSMLVIGLGLIAGDIALSGSEGMLGGLAYPALIATAFLGGFALIRLTRKSVAVARDLA